MRNPGQLITRARRSMLISIASVSLGIEEGLGGSVVALEEQSLLLMTIKLNDLRTGTSA